MRTITHPTMGTTAPIAWTVGTDAGEVAAVNDRFGWCFYLLPKQELIGLIFRGKSCDGSTLAEVKAMPWSRTLPAGTRLTGSNLANLALEVGNKHAELRASGEWARYTIERIARQQRIDLELEGSNG